MNEKQCEEFEHIAWQCESGQFRSINVASKIRSDTIVAVWYELSRLQSRVEELEKSITQTMDELLRG